MSFAKSVKTSLKYFKEWKDMENKIGYFLGDIKPDTLNKAILHNVYGMPNGNVHYKLPRIYSIVCNDPFKANPDLDSAIDEMLDMHEDFIAEVNKYFICRIGACSYNTTDLAISWLTSVLGKYILTMAVKYKTRVMSGELLKSILRVSFFLTEESIYEKDYNGGIYCRYTDFNFATFPWYYRTTLPITGDEEYTEAQCIIRELLTLDNSQAYSKEYFLLSIGASGSCNLTHINPMYWLYDVHRDQLIKYIHIHNEVAEAIASGITEYDHSVVYKKQGDLIRIPRKQVLQAMLTYFKKFYEISHLFKDPITGKVDHILTYENRRGAVTIIPFLRTSTLFCKNVQTWALMTDDEFMDWKNEMLALFQ